MDLSHFHDLYRAETQEHLRALNRGLLALEAGDTQAVDEAFRAAHTIKGMAATMGDQAVADHAHRLENLLDAVRKGERTVTAELVDTLLAGADTLEKALEEAGTCVGTGTDAGAGAQEPTPAPVAAGREAGGGARAPAGAVLVVRVRLDANEPLVAARAAVIERRLAEIAPVVARAIPAEDEPGRECRFHLGQAVAPEAVVAAVRGAGSVESVEVERADALAAGGASAAPKRAGVRREGLFRVDLRRIDELSAGIGELGVLHGRLAELAGQEGSEALRDLADALGRLSRELQDTVLSVRMVPVGESFGGFPRLVRDAARSLGRQVDLVIEGADIELDRAILDGIVDPLVHLLRNAVDHGIETPAEREAAGKPPRGRLTLSAVRERSRVVIGVTDDGRGIDRAAIAAQARAEGLLAEEDEDLTDDELLRVLCRAGFTTARSVTTVSGRGVGLDVVAERLRQLGGRLELRTTPGRGTTFSLHLPVTLAVAQALRVQVGGGVYLVPLTHVAEAVELSDAAIRRVRGREVLRLREELMPLVRLRCTLGAGEEGCEAAAVIVEAGERRAALAVDALLGREQIVVKTFDAAVGTLPVFSGVALLGDGRPALVLDPMNVL